jgi:hypothetical protein
MDWGWQLMRGMAYGVDASAKAAYVPAKVGLQWAAFFGDVEHEVHIAMISKLSLDMSMLLLLM